ncbi:hypothetical protein GCM10007863_44100 [Dyella mobilis]|nr:hypothetical protein GCM10007863_44100 [Dyella mobilis]
MQPGQEGQGIRGEDVFVAGNVRVDAGRLDDELFAGYCHELLRQGFGDKLVSAHHFDKTNVSIIDIVFINTYAKVLKNLS